ncbi:MAG: signal recognition particle protein [Bacteroidales bacterium]|jgi:signal recognition particle subunit SRP54|nr:signal recognition particle protein [Bacteroidales bacterium]
MFESLSDNLERAFKVLKGQGHISEINVAETMKEVRKALLDADVSYKIAKELTDKVKKEAVGQNVMTSVSPSQLMIKIVHDELVKLMGSSHVELNLKSNPSIILMAGLQGSGKTTHAAKLAHFLKTKRNKKVLLVAGDVYRPAAIEQLKVLGQQIQVDIFTEEGNTKPVDLAKKGVAHAKEWGHSVVIIDTAGRLAVDKEMMDEISNIKEAVNPGEILFVVDSMTGQDAVNTAKAFHDTLNFDGIILTKLDGDTRGGAALTIRYVVEKPIKFIGVGEKMEDLDIFHPSRMADRILGMGDIVSFVERAQEQYNEEEARKIQKKLAKDQFNFNDFLDQIQQIKKMGNMKSLMSMIPGIGKMVKDMDIDENAFKEIEAIIHSMTPLERTNPSVLNGSRRKRIAEGSGTSIQDVNKLMKQFENTRKVMKIIVTGRGRNDVIKSFKNLP